jgi:hypothetical protein
MRKGNKNAEYGPCVTEYRPGSAFREVPRTDELLVLPVSVVFSPSWAAAACPRAGGAVQVPLGQSGLLCGPVPRTSSRYNSSGGLLRCMSSSGWQ